MAEVRGREHTADLERREAPKILKRQLNLLEKMADLSIAPFLQRPPKTRESAQLSSAEEAFGRMLSFGQSALQKGSIEDIAVLAGLGYPGAPEMLDKLFREQQAGDREFRPTPLGSLLEMLTTGAGTVPGTGLPARDVFTREPPVLSEPIDQLMLIRRINEIMNMGAI